MRTNIETLFEISPHQTHYYLCKYNFVRAAVLKMSIKEKKGRRTPCQSCGIAYICVNLLTKGSIR